MGLFGLKHHEFWHPRVFELPFYFYLLSQCVRYGVGIRGLAKANYVLNHGEIGIGSKYHTQTQFGQNFFLPTQLLDAVLSQTQRAQIIKDFAFEHGYPLILKPDIGRVGKGILKLNSDHDVEQRVAEVNGHYLLQKYTDYAYEYGVFFIRDNGESRITGINRKHFPSVIGDGKQTIQQLAENHYRYTDHWSTFLQYIDTQRIPEDGEDVRLSFIGSHTMGCLFTDDTRLLSKALEKRVFEMFEEQPGFNFGRLDIKAKDEKAFIDGDFIVIEVNGISSLPTHMFDPKFTLVQAYKIFFEHGKYLAKIAKQQADKPMPLKSLWAILKDVAKNQKALDQIHNKLKA